MGQYQRRPADFRSFPRPCPRCRVGGRDPLHLRQLDILPVRNIAYRERRDPIANPTYRSASHQARPSRRSPISAAVMFAAVFSNFSEMRKNRFSQAICQNSLPNAKASEPRLTGSALTWLEGFLACSNAWSRQGWFAAQVLPTVVVECGRSPANPRIKPGRPLRLTVFE